MVKPLYLVGYAYFPGHAENVDSIYVKKSKMREFAKTAIGKPLNRKHPNEGESPNANEIGRIVDAVVDKETGALLVRAKLHESPHAMLAYDEVLRGSMPHFSVGKSYMEDERTLDVWGHTVDEISCVEQGDMEHGVNFTTSIFAPDAMGDEHVEARNSVLQALGVQTSSTTNERHAVASSNSSRSHRRVRTMASTSQQQQTPPPPEQSTSDKGKEKENSGAAAEEDEPEMTQEEFDSISSKLMKNARKKVNKDLEPEQNKLKEEQSRLDARAQELKELQTQRMGEYRVALADYILRAGSVKETDEDEEKRLEAKRLKDKGIDKESIDAYSNNLFDPADGETGLFTKAQMSTARVVSAFASEGIRSMSEADKMRKFAKASLEKAKRAEKEAAKYKRQLGIASDLPAGKRPLAADDSDDDDDDQHGRQKHSKKRSAVAGSAKSNMFYEGQRGGKIRPVTEPVITPKGLLRHEAPRAWDWKG